MKQWIIPVLLALLIIINAVVLTKFSETNQKSVEQQSTIVETKNSLRSVSKDVDKLSEEKDTINSSLKEQRLQNDSLETENADLKVSLQAKKDAEAKAAQVVVAPIVATPVAAISGNKSDWLAASGIPSSDWTFVDYIISHESSWNPTRYNSAGSGAYGLGQALPASKMAAYGSDYMTNPATQLKWANAYAVGRYGSWSAAYNFWLSNSWW